MTTDSIDGLLTELEELSAKALQETEAGNLTSAMHTIAQRGVAVGQLPTALAAAAPVTYVEWNRIAVIHFQGNRIQASLQAVRQRFAGERVQTAREQALLECVTGVVGKGSRRQLDERG